MAVVTSGNSSSSGVGGGGRGGSRTDEAIASFGGGAADSRDFSYDEDDDDDDDGTLDDFIDPPDETLKIILYDGQTVAIKHQGDLDDEDDEDSSDMFVYGGPTSEQQNEDSDVKVYKVLVKGQQSSGGASDGEGPPPIRGRNAAHLPRSSSVTFSDELHEQKGHYEFMDEPIVRENGSSSKRRRHASSGGGTASRKPRLKSALRKSVSTTDESTLTSSNALPPNPGTSPRHYPNEEVGCCGGVGGGDTATDGEAASADAIFNFVEGEKRRERRRLLSARSKNRLLRRHCSNKENSISVRKSHYNYSPLLRGLYVQINGTQRIVNSWIVYVGWRSSN